MTSPAKGPVCARAFRELYVSVEGLCFPCCRGAFVFRAVGQFFGSVPASWTGKSLAAFREAWLRGEKPAPCVDCRQGSRRTLEIAR